MESNSIVFNLYNIWSKFLISFDLSYYAKLLPNFLIFYRNIFHYWSQHLTVSPELPSSILATFLCYNKDILIHNKPIYFKHFSNNNLNYVTQPFYDTGNTKEWVKLKHKFNLNHNLCFNWMWLIHSIPQKWKNIKNNGISENLLFLNHHLTKCNILLTLKKLNSKELYLIQLTHDFCKPTNSVLDWKYIYILPCIVTSDPYTCYFQYRVLKNVLYLKEKLFFFWYIWNFSMRFL